MMEDIEKHGAQVLGKRNKNSDTRDKHGFISFRYFIKFLVIQTIVANKIWKADANFVI